MPFFEKTQIGTKLWLKFHENIVAFTDKHESNLKK